MRSILLDGLKEKLKFVENWAYQNNISIYYGYMVNADKYYLFAEKDDKKCQIFLDLVEIDRNIASETNRLKEIITRSFED